MLSLCNDRKQPENIREKMYLLLSQSTVVEKNV